MHIGESIAVFTYSLKTRKPFYIVAFLLLGFTFWEFLTGWQITGVIESYWSTKIDPLIGIATLIIALSVWRGEIVEEWKRTMSKKLSVVFWFEGRKVMRCNYADLSSEADIRALSQQIGSHMANAKRLDFMAPVIKLEVGKPCRDKETGKFIRPYSAEFELRTLPETSQIKSLGEGEYLIWEPPFSGAPEKKNC